MSSQPSLTTTNTYMYPRPHSRVHSRLHTVYFLMLILTDKNAHSKRIFANSGTHTQWHTQQRIQNTSNFCLLGKNLVIFLFTSFCTQLTFSDTLDYIIANEHRTESATGLNLKACYRADGSVERIHCMYFMAKLKARQTTSNDVDKYLKTYVVYL